MKKKSVITFPNLRKHLAIACNAFVIVAFATQCLCVFANTHAVAGDWDNVVEFEIFVGTAFGAYSIEPLSALPLSPRTGFVPVRAIGNSDSRAVALSGAILPVGSGERGKFDSTGFARNHFLVAENGGSAFDVSAGSPAADFDCTPVVSSLFTAYDAGDGGFIFLPAPFVSSVALLGAELPRGIACIELEFDTTVIAKSLLFHNLSIPKNIGVVKPSLIDLEALARATGGKVTATAYRPERLSGMDAIKRMRQSGLVYNAQMKHERWDEEPTRYWLSPLVVTDTENSTFKYYSGYEELDINPSDVMSAAEYNWKQSACVVSASGLEADVQNSGKEAVINLVEKRIKNAFRTMKNQTSVGIYSDGTGYSSKQITGLQAQIANDPTTGTVGGINRATWTFWRNKYASNATWTSAVIKGYMKNLYMQCTRGTDMPDLITMDANTYEIFWDSLSDLQRVTHENDKATMGWQNVAFQNADVIYDGDSGHPANTLYMLNTDYLFFRPHVNRNFEPLDKRDSVNQDAYVVPIVFAGNLTMSNASLQGVYFKS